MPFGYVNARSVCNKATVIKDYVIEHDLDMVILTETWLNKTNDRRVTAELLPNGYSIVHKMRVDKRGGGIAVMCRNGDTHMMNMDLVAQPTSFENMELKLAMNTQSVHLFVIYRPPSTTENAKQIFLDEFAELLSQIAISPNEALIIGDFNLHWDSQSDPFISHFNSLLHEADCCQHVTGATHVAGHTLDLIITKRTGRMLESIYVASLLSDHFVIHGTMLVHKPPRPRKQITFRPYRSLDHDALVDDTLQ